MGKNSTFGLLVIEAKKDKQETRAKIAPSCILDLLSVTRLTGFDLNCFITIQNMY